MQLDGRRVHGVLQVEAWLGLGLGLGLGLANPNPNLALALTLTLTPTPYLQGGEDADGGDAATTGGGDEGFEDEDKVEL